MVQSKGGITVTNHRLFAFILCFVLIASAASAVPTNILYLNSTRGAGTGALGNFRHVIANAIDDYDGGAVFDVDFVQNHVGGNLSAHLGAHPIDYYDQIWFDTTILNTILLNGDDLTALNAWAANDQPEFILDSSYFFRNKTSNVLSASATAVTVNEALALRGAGGGILIGTDHHQFADTANQILDNFGFDGAFTGSFNITPNATFVGDLLIQPEAVNGPQFFVNHLQGLSTSNVPIGLHTLNGNGGNRNIEIFEALFSNSPGHVSHVGASFETGDGETPVLPEPTSTALFILGMGALGLFRRQS